MSTRTSNQACWLLHKQAYPYTVDEAPMPTLGDKQVLVRVRAVAINPADWVRPIISALRFAAFQNIARIDVNQTTK